MDKRNGKLEAETKKMSTQTRKRNGKTLYVRFIFSFLAILMIPLTIITTVFSSRFLKRFEEEVLETVDMELDQMMIYTDILLSQIQSTAVRLSIDGTLRVALKAESPVDFIPVMNYLSIITSANNQFDDIILFLDCTDYIVTSTTTWQKDLFFKRNFTDPGKARSVLEQNMGNGFMPLYIDSSSLGYGQEDKIFMLLPLYTDYMERRGNVLFVLPDDVFSEYIGTRLKAYNATALIFNENGDCVYCSSPDFVLSDFPEKDMDDYIIRRRTSEGTGWQGYAIMAKSQTVFEQVVTISREFEITMLVIALLAGIAIMLLSQINYSPIRKLNSKAAELIPGRASGNEFENISKTMDFLKTENTSLSAKLEESMEAVKNVLIMRLISGEYSSKEDFNEDAADLDIALEKEYFTVALIRTAKPDEEFAIRIKRAFPDIALIYCRNPFNPSTLVFLANTDSDKSAIRIFQDMLAFMKSTLNTEATIGVGSTANDTERIPRSYIDANSALDYRFIKGNGTLISYSEAVSSDSDILYPNKEFEVLSNALSSMNKDAIQDAIGNITKVLSTEGIPLYLARNICFDMIHMVSKSKAFQSSGKIETPFKLTGMETADEIISMIIAWQQSLKPSIPQNVSMQSIQKYLTENCLKCSFSVYEAAEHFGMSLSAFSKYYKDSTGANIIDYTTTIRIEKAKELLRDTNTPITEIAESVGYYNLSSFTRRFKLNQGISPSEYRSSFS